MEPLIVKRKILLLTPPLLQTNSPYPATMHLAGWLGKQGIAWEQRDLSIKVVRDVLLGYGDETTEELLEFLGGNAPPEMKREASEEIDSLAIAIRDEIDPEFGFGRYAEEKCRAVSDFGLLEKLVRRRGVIDAPLRRHLKAAMDETKPTEVWVTCPFRGTLVGAFKIAKYVRAHYPKVKLALGGGYVNTELRSMTDRRPYRYFDEFQFDSPYADAFVAPDYRGIDWNEYFDVVETDNFVTNLWNSGKWVKLVMAQGCYWHKCAFCDVCLPYIDKFRMPSASAIVDCMEGFAGNAARPESAPYRDAAHVSRFHFVDEAMPPALVRGVCEEILRRGLEVEWWGNVRFDAAFTPTLAKLMAAAGCIAVTGGLECANDRLLKLMNKGITLAGAEKVLKAFKRAGILVHAYLMYGFPSETLAEQKGAERYVKSLAKRGLIHSAFWHRFALTVHSPIVKDPARFGIRVTSAAPERADRVFAVNELEYRRLRRAD